MIKKVLKQLQRNKLQSVFLFVPVFILSAILFGSVVIDTGLKEGTKNLEKRMGADLMIVPQGEKDLAGSIISEGARGTFYLERSVYDIALKTKGVAAATPQFFLKSLAADCCSSEVEIVFYEPKTDFIIHPWISKEYEKQQDKNEVVVGSSINEEEGGVIKLFGRQYKIAARMAKTGTSLDSSVYFTFESMDTVINDAINKGSFLTKQQTKSDIISSVFVNVSEGYDESEVFENIKNNTTQKIDVVYPKQIEKNISVSIDGIYSALHMVSTVTLVLIFVILICVNIIIANERKREIALFGIVGATKKKIINMVCLQSLFVGAAGGIAGGLLGALFTIPFGDYIGMKLDMPYPGPAALETVLLLVIITVIAAGIGFVTSLIPVWRLSQIAPYTALRRDGD